MKELLHKKPDFTIKDKSEKFTKSVMIRSDYQILDALAVQPLDTINITESHVTTRPANNMMRIRDALHAAAQAAGLDIDRMDTLWCKRGNHGGQGRQGRYALNPKVRGIAHTLITDYIKRTHKEGDAQ